MYFALLLSGLYLGGVLIVFLDAWIRKDDAWTAQTLGESFGWPLGVFMLSLLGRADTRKMLGLTERDEHFDRLYREVETLKEGAAEIAYDHKLLVESVDAVLVHDRTVTCQRLTLVLEVYAAELAIDGGSADLDELRRRFAEAIAELAEDRGQDGIG